VIYEICLSLNSHFSQHYVYKHKTIPEFYNSVNFLNFSRYSQYGDRICISVFERNITRCGEFYKAIFFLRRSDHYVAGVIIGHCASMMSSAPHRSVPP